MAGHSKWANIKHKKAATDARRSKVWSKLSKAIMVAAKSGARPRRQYSAPYRDQRSQGVQFAQRQY